MVVGSSQTATDSGEADVGALTGVTSIKKFKYRGNDEEWSNTYHFRDNPPSTSADWHTLVMALGNLEAGIIRASDHIVRFYGYDTDDAKPISVYTLDLEAEGTPIPGTWVPQATDDDLAGDQAYFAEWQLDHKNSRGKWVYLRKYLHGGQCLRTNPDAPSAAYRGAVDTYARALWNGTTGFHGGLRARTGTWPILWTGTSDFITTRTLKRRGKRPPTPA